MRFGNAPAHAADHAGAVRPHDLKAAYERGRREERARHHRSPFLTLTVGAAALVGGATLVLSALHGSFAGGGASIDHGLSAAVRNGGPALRDMADGMKARTDNAVSHKGG